MGIRGSDTHAVSFTDVVVSKQNQIGADGFGFAPNDNGQYDKVPQMGWNAVRQRKSHAVFNGIDDNSEFYFVHSYYAALADNPHVAGTCTYGVDFAAALSLNNLFAVQFHPEKSADAGLQLLRNFVNWTV